ncbi:CD3324 family protein [Eubacterium sp. 1001713B170207_170306_E7]|uniref:CD3324 family protein n=1 Tax=Eubacterium sp. 1001713B170207_170306_E7 TaxID=2787097 RepID=UPI00189A1C2D|nr:CD3324 family protein [Eubacterium sp. 1001713B170207_170306_E7]
MSYIKAGDVLPKELVDKIQDYIDGEYIYVPRKEKNRKVWGQNTNRKQETLLRNREIYRQYLEGTPVSGLSEAYFLSPKSIQKIIAKCKLENQ